MPMASTSMLVISKSITRGTDRKFLVPSDLLIAYTDWKIGIQMSTKERTSGEGRCRTVDKTGPIRTSGEIPIITRTTHLQICAYFILHLLAVMEQMSAFVWKILLLTVER